ncbi:MAG: integrase, partial [Acidobacteria bacterium]|nr:integrase [Acidobacteriota bacterium]
SERTGRALSQMGLTRTVQGIAGTIHGFRSSFRDWASEETAHDFAVVETALAHAVGSGVERAYRRGDLLAKRRLLMNAWAEYVVVEK